VTRWGDGWSDIVTQRRPQDIDTQSGLWSRKRFADARLAQTVVVAHGSTAVGESIALLLNLAGFVAFSIRDIASIEIMLQYWKPGAVLVDTRLCGESDFRFVREAANDPAFGATLFLAMTSVMPEESPEAIKDIGFDGLCRKPCPVWKLADMLHVHFAQCPP
jgi:DNA-binding response OmpR family regulator